MTKKITKIMSWLKDLPVRRKVVSLLLFVAYLTVILIAGVSFITGRNVINQQIEKELDFTITSVIDEINKFIFERQNDLQLLLSDSTLNDPQTSPERKREVLRNQLVKLGWYDNLHFVDTNGKIIATTNRGKIDKEVNQLDWYLSTLEDYRHVSDVTTFSSNDQTIIMASIVANEDNQVSGMVVTELSWALIEETLNKVPTGFELFLYDSNEKLIASNMEIAVAASATERESLATQNNYIVSTVESPGYQTFSGNNWQLTAQIPTELAYAPINTFARYLLLAVVLISLVALWLGNYSANIFVKPLKKLTAGVRLVSSGKLGHTIELKNQDEFGYLAENFNQMSSNIRIKNQKLVEEKGKYKSIIESSEEGIILIDKNQKLLAHNNKFKRLLSLKEKKIIGKPVQELFKFLEVETEDKQNKTQFKRIKKVLARPSANEAKQFEVKLEKPQFRLLQIYTGPVKTENERLLGYIWAFRDVTKEREAEKAKNDFIRVASHKLRTPLTALRWQTQIIKANHQSMPPGCIKAMNAITQHTAKLNSLTKLLMTAAEIKDEKISLNKASEDILDTINNAVKDAQKVYSELRISVKSSAKLRELLIDKEKIEQIITAIIENSYYYRKSGKLAHIKIEVKQSSKGTIITITDKGIGCTKEDNSKLFEKFFRSASALHAYPDGTGLNLYLAKIIVKSHGGTIKASGEVNKGFAVTIHLK